MSQRVFQPIISVTLILLVVVQLTGQESASGMVYANGSASVNGNEIPNSVAVFPGDALQTQPDGSATIGTKGSSVMVYGDSAVKYEGGSVGVVRGSVRVNTTTQFAAHACDIWAKPVGSLETQYQFTHADGYVTVAATKSDVILENRKASGANQEPRTDQSSKIVKEGEQTTREDGCEVANGPKRRPSAPMGIGNPPVLYTTIGVTGGVLTWVLLHGHGHHPISPASPGKDEK